ncbi:MAG TPA: class I SAM-dependent methyltransferase [Anaerolineales bacterium]|nr:class I SAM-dependent methyltransferase [Anaerolineales bacterium]
MLEIRHERMVETSATQEAYNQIFNEGGLKQRDSYYLWLLEKLRPEPGKFLLDISCGHGRVVTLAQAQGLRAIGMDFAQEGLRFGIKATPQAGWSVADGEQLPVASDSVDYITHLGSLEHYMAPASGAREIARILKPGGRACILLPNAYGLFGNISYVMKRGEIFDDGQPLQRYATRQTWTRLLESGGLKVEQTLGYGEVEWPRTSQDMAWFLRHPVKWARFLLSFGVPLNLSNQLVFLCGKK